MDKSEFKSFFSQYSKNVDQAERQGFWKLSDRLVEAIIVRELAGSAATGTIMDAGGGTGRWTVRLAALFPGAAFVLYDLSEDMLSVAQKNIAGAGLDNRVNIVQGNLEHIEAAADNSIDGIVSLYAPISFVEQPWRAFAEFRRVLKPGGKALIMGHGYYNALYSKITNYCCSAAELRQLESSREVKWAEYVPALRTFGSDSYRQLAADAGLKLDGCYGVPLFVQPGAEDFDPTNQKISRISQALRSEDFFQAVFETEMKHNRSPELVNRGVNVMAVLVK